MGSGVIKNSETGVRGSKLSERRRKTAIAGQSQKERAPLCEAMEVPLGYFRLPMLLVLLATKVQKLNLWIPERVRNDRDNETLDCFAPLTMTQPKTNPPTHHLTNPLLHHSPSLPSLPIFVPRMLLS